jgi:hypothetical protein
MLSVGRRLASPRTVILTTSVAAIGGGGSYYLGYKKETTSRTVSDEHPISSTVGLKRQLTFWARILPVVADYYWHFASSSPYVKYQEARKNKNNISSEQGRQLTVTRNQRLQDCHQRHAPEILQVILELKGLFIKLGQVLSVSALPVPEPYRVRFRTLQDTVPGHEDFETIQAILEKEFGQPLDNLFERIEENPVGAASIGQAHRAVLKETGEQVIVKVQYIYFACDDETALVRSYRTVWVSFNTNFRLSGTIPRCSLASTSRYTMRRRLYEAMCVGGCIRR